MSLVRICDICWKPVRDENIQTVIVKDSKGCQDNGFGGFMSGGKRKFEMDICDDCLSIFKTMRREETGNLVWPGLEKGEENES